MTSRFSTQKKDGLVLRSIRDCKTNRSLSMHDGVCQKYISGCTLNQRMKPVQEESMFYPGILQLDHLHVAGLSCCQPVHVHVCSWQHVAVVVVCVKLQKGGQSQLCMCVCLYVCVYAHAHMLGVYTYMGMPHAFSLSLMCVCVCAWLKCVRVCVRACVHACVRVCACVILCCY